MASERKVAATSPAFADRRDWLLTALLFAAALIAYFPAMHGGLLLDDDLHITRPELQSWRGLGRIWFDVGATQQYYPVLHSAFWLEHRLWSDSVTGYHLCNVLLHASAAGLVVLLMRGLRLPGAWLAAFLFALHPVCVESVAWIAEQKNTLSTVFALGAAIAYLDFDERRSRTAYWLALGLFAMALLSKTVVVTLPAVLLVVAWWRRSRIDWRRDVLPLLPWFVIGGAVCLITLSVERRLLAGIGAAFTLGPVERVLLAARAFWFYLGELIWPVGLTFFYPKWVVSSAAAWAYLFPLAAATLAGGLWYLARRWRGPLAAFLCFAGTLVPVLGFFNVEWFVFSYVADHLQYFSILAVVIPVSAALTMSAARLSAACRQIAVVIAAAWVLGLGVLTWQQCGRYGDPVVFYRTAIALNPASAAAYSNLGAVLAALPGRQAEAIAAYEKARQMSPNSSDAEENLGAVLAKDPAHRAQGVAHLEAAVHLRPGKKLIHEKLAAALVDMPGRLSDAIAEYEASLQIDPNDPEVHNSLGSALLRDPRRLGEAQAEFETALRLKADFAEAHNNLGNALRRMPGRVNDAIQQYEEALRLKPDLAEAHNDLGLVLAPLPGRLNDAIAQFQEALRLKPDFAGAHSNLGLAWMLTPGRLNDAVSELKEAVRLKPDFAQAWHVLGIAWMRSDNPREAVAAFRAEVRLSPENAAAREALDAATLASLGH